MRQQVETVLDRGLTGSLDGKTLLFETRIGKGIEDARALVLRPPLYHPIHARAH